MSAFTFDVPAGAAAQVHIIDTGVHLRDLPTSMMFTPAVDEFEKFSPLGSWSFLVQSSRGERVLFDLGIPPDVKNYPPSLHELLSATGCSIEGTRNVTDVLKEHGTDPSDIQSIIWSHHHFDHIGDVTTFPKGTEIVVGPGFKKAFLPAYPTAPDNWLEERHFDGRNLREISFSDPASSVKIGAFRAFDFFGDGSFYLLDAPGHTVGHLGGLARTSQNPDTFIFMGADICHHGGEIRPSPGLPIPENVQFPLSDALRARISVCPGAAQFRNLNIKRGRQANEPFFDPLYVDDVARSIQTIKDTQSADAQSNVFFIFAHDMSIEGIVDFFPKSVNEWQAKGWREKAMWKFLADLTPAAISESQ
ncbi:beta-lactamase-like protein [Xylariaceae sp. FL1272]|nr:beta-lactamase-like protein [Xylariaceae sp. FL1272]